MNPGRFTLLATVFATVWAGRAAPVVTTQVAPTILAALNLDPTLLNAVKAERTSALPGITFP